MRGMDTNNKTPAVIRPIKPIDIDAVADIIRQVMSEFKAVGCGYSINDSEVGDMFTAYAPDGAEFFVIELADEILGCGGYAQLNGGDQDTCELRKMYFLPQLRGTGMGTVLLELCLKRARQHGYRYCYLETIEGMKQARKLYERYGFKYLDKAMGNTGHGSCNTRMIKDL
jgi:putative acetyltransferase